MQKAFVARPLVKPSGSMTAIKIIGAVFAAMVALLLGLIVLLLIGVETGPLPFLIGMVSATLPVPFYLMLVLWIDRYEEDVVFSEHPGSKLYLLLKDVLLQDRPEWRAQRYRKLFPAKLPPKHVVTSRRDSTRLRIRAMGSRISFVWKRLRFHITAGLRYKIEAARWKRFVAGSRA